MTKLCRDCNISKPLTTEFFEKRSDNGLYRHSCKTCINTKHVHQYKIRLKDKIADRNLKLQAEDALFSEGKATCQCCKQIQHINAFNKHKQGRFGIETTCKNCKAHKKEENVISSSELRRCRECGVVATSLNDLHIFAKGSAYKFGRQNWCISCRNNNEKSISNNNSLEKRVKKFGITVTQYEDMITSQNNSCAICKKHKDDFTGRGKNFHIDHCHTSGKVRGLLCSNCNTGLGQFKDNVQYLENAIQYVIETK